MKVLTVCALAVAFGHAAFAEETVNLQDLPAAVKTAVKAQTGGATILRASKEREDGRITYEVETKLDGKGRDLTFDERGSLLEVEQEVNLGSIPGPARKAIQKNVAGGTIKKVESVTQGSKTTYEADVKAPDGSNQEVAVNADGSTHKLQ